VSTNLNALQGWQCCLAPAGCRDACVSGMAQHGLGQMNQALNDWWEEHVVK
jgi:hypothetical protein